ncbi:MAG TPA: hypothetical protein VF506_20145 [Streptosporangiaceae bacterium]
MSDVDSDLLARVDQRLESASTYVDLDKDLVDGLLSEVQEEQ